MRRTVTGSIHGTNCPCGIRIPPNTVHECDVDRIAELEAENERLRDDKIDLINQIDNDERAERLKCCGNCGHWWSGLLGCEMDPEEDGAVCEGFDACHVFNQSDEGPREPCWQPYSRERR